MTAENARLLDVFWPLGDGGLRQNTDEGSKLEQCSLSYSNCEYPWDLKTKILFFLHPTLRALTIKKCLLDDYNNSLYADTLRQHPLITQRSSLKELNLSFCQVEASSLGELLSFTDNLEKLSLTYYMINRRFSSDLVTSRDGATYFKSIEKRASTLTHLLVLGVWTSPESVHKPTFLHFPKLRHLYTSTSFLGFVLPTHDGSRQHNWSQVVPALTEDVVILPMCDAGGSLCYSSRGARIEDLRRIRQRARGGSGFRTEVFAIAMALTERCISKRNDETALLDFQPQQQQHSFPAGVYWVAEERAAKLMHLFAGS